MKNNKFWNIEELYIYHYLGKWTMLKFFNLHIQVFIDKKNSTGNHVFLMMKQRVILIQNLKKKRGNKKTLRVRQSVLIWILSLFSSNPLQEENPETNKQTPSLKIRKTQAIFHFLKDLKTTERLEGLPLDQLLPARKQHRNK